MSRSVAMKAAYLPASNTSSSFSRSVRPCSADPRAARVRNRVSASNSAMLIVASSSISLFTLISRCFASCRRRLCLSSGNRIVRVLIGLGGCKELLWGEDTQSGEVQLAPSNIADIVGDNYICASCYGEFDQMIVRLVGQIRSPKIVYSDPFTDGEKRFEKTATLQRSERTFPERFRSSTKIFVFMKQGDAHKRLIVATQATPQNLTIIAAGSSQQRSDHDIRVHNNSRNHRSNDSICAITSSMATKNEFPLLP